MPPPAAPLQEPRRSPVPALVRWPGDAAVRAALASQGRPRLLVIESATPPPLMWDDREDWIRSTADPVEVEARWSRLAAAADAPDACPPDRLPLPLLDAVGHLQAADGREVHLDPVETRMVRLLLVSCDRIVRRDELRTAAWPSGSVSERAVDGRISRLRRGIGAVGLQIVTVRGRGYLLERLRS